MIDRVMLWLFVYGLVTAALGVIEAQTRAEAIYHLIVAAVDAAFIIYFEKKVSK